MVLITVIGCCVPLFFMKNRVQSCNKRFSVPPTIPLNLPDFVNFWIDPSADPVLLVSPPEMASILGENTGAVPFEIVADNASFVSYVNANYWDLSLGGLSFDLETGNALVAWEADPPGLTGPALLNLASNTLLNHAFGINASAGNASSIDAVYRSFSYPNAGTLFALKWAGFFGLAMVGALLKSL
jgi:hypothetical protein